MENSFVNALKRESNITTTENGMQCLKSTTSALVDLFGTIGALRSRSDDEIIQKFVKAFCEDRLLATKMSFYARDIRYGGLGERRIPRVIWKYMANNYSDIIDKNVALIPKFGRWDDLYCLIDTPCENKMWETIRSQWAMDNDNMRTGKPISIMSKWLPSVNASSKITIANGKRTATALGLSYATYRKALSKFRAYLSVVETMMSSNKWDNINYESVPSKAMNNYRSAFAKHDNERFGAYLADVSTGEKKINSSTLFPYDITEKYMYKGNYRYDSVLEEQWKALPNYVVNDDNVLVMADVSGSMWGRPMATSVGLAIYFAERTHGAFSNSFMTFSSTPELVQLQGNNLMEKINNAKSAHWGMNTNIKAAFDLILKTAINNHIPKNDMPKAIVIISDMEFDYCAIRGGWDFYTQMKNDFANAGYDIPNIVFWNVCSRNDTYHAVSKYEGVQLMSGQSASVFKAMLENIGTTPYQAMLNVLNSEVYNDITV